MLHIKELHIVTLLKLERALRDGGIRLTTTETGGIVVWGMQWKEHHRLVYDGYRNGFAIICKECGNSMYVKHNPDCYYAYLDLVDSNERAAMKLKLTLTPDDNHTEDSRNTPKFKEGDYVWIIDSNTKGYVQKVMQEYQSSVDCIKKFHYMVTIPKDENTPFSFEELCKPHQYIWCWEEDIMPLVKTETKTISDSK